MTNTPPTMDTDAANASRDRRSPSLRVNDRGAMRATFLLSWTILVSSLNYEQTDMSVSE